MSPPTQAYTDIQIPLLCNSKSFFPSCLTLSFLSLIFFSPVSFHSLASCLVPLRIHSPQFPSCFPIFLPLSHHTTNVYWILKQTRKWQNKIVTGINILIFLFWNSLTLKALSTCMYFSSSTILTWTLFLPLSSSTPPPLHCLHFILCRSTADNLCGHSPVLCLAWDCRHCYLFPVSSGGAIGLFLLKSLQFKTSVYLQWAHWEQNCLLQDISVWQAIQMQPYSKTNTPQLDFGFFFSSVLDQVCINFFFCAPEIHKLEN